MSTVTRWTTAKPLKLHGSVVLSVNIGPGRVNRFSAVFASITELQGLAHPPTFPYPVDVPFVGSASMEIRNIAPRDDGVVDLWVEIDWPYNLYVSIQLLVSND